MSRSDWERKMIKDTYLATVPAGLRQQMIQQGTTVLGEATTSGAIMAPVSPMLVGVEPGNEVDYNTGFDNLEDNDDVEDDIEGDDTDSMLSGYVDHSDFLAGEPTGDYEL